MSVDNSLSLLSFYLLFSYLLCHFLLRDSWFRIISFLLRALWQILLRQFPPVFSLYLFLFASCLRDERISSSKKTLPIDARPCLQSQELEQNPCHYGLRM